MRSWPGKRFAWLVLGLCGCLWASHSSSNEVKTGHDPDGDTTVKNPIEIRLVAAPTRLSMSERDRFRIGLVATNTSDAAVDPHLFGVRLLVDGMPSAAFDLAVGNTMPAKWDVLPAGATTPAVEWPLGTALFTKPGEYVLVLRLEWEGWTPVESSVTVTVTP